MVRLGSSGAVVAAFGVDGEVAEEPAGGGVDDADVEVGDEEDDGGSVEGSSEADVVELAVDADRDVAVADAVAADSGSVSVRPVAALGRAEYMAAGVAWWV
ncbi:MAG: hypothetical protein U0Q22_19165 [Acidimicrobiales bacterium]